MITTDFFTQYPVSINFKINSFKSGRVFCSCSESLNVQPSCCLDVEVYMLNCVFWRHILLEVEFKSPVDMGSDSNRYTAQRYHP